MKNKHTKFRIVGGGIGLAGAILAIVGIGTAIAALIIVGLIILLGGVIFYAVATSNSRSYCDKCGASLKGCAWEYDTVSAEQRFNEQKQEWYQHYKINIRAKCPNCGAVKEYNAKFICKAEENVQFKVEQYMRAKFGDRL